MTCFVADLGHSLYVYITTSAVFQVWQNTKKLLFHYKEHDSIICVTSYILS